MYIDIERTRHIYNKILEIAKYCEDKKNIERASQIKEFAKLFYIEFLADKEDTETVIEKMAKVDKRYIPIKAKP